MVSVNGSEASAGGLLSRAFAASGSPSITVLATAFAAVFVSLLIIDRIIAAPVDPREPPVVKSSIPVIGHWLSLATQYPDIYQKIATRTGLPLCTVQVLNKKMYLFNTSTVIQSGMRNKRLGFGDRLEEISKAMGIPEVARRNIQKGTAMEDVHDITLATLSGENLVRLNLIAMNWVGGQLNAVKPGSPVKIDSFFIWTRNLISIATTWGLYGKHNPFTDPNLLNCIWEVEEGIGWMGYGWLSRNILAPKAAEARKKMIVELVKYYSAGHDSDPSASALVRGRAKFWRNAGLDGKILGMSDGLPNASTVNTAPTMFWLLVGVFADPELLARTRAEVESAGVLEIAPREEGGGGGGGGRVATLDVAGLSKRCALLVACYRETLRYYNNVIGSRSVMKEDTSITDHDTGREYLLKKGVVVRWTAYVSHNEPVWGDRPGEFLPDRWLESPLEENKARRDSFIPFGGGKNLCPGRNFAVAELVGTLACLVAGFDIEGLTVPDHKLKFEFAAVRFPVYNKGSQSATLSRRAGWEDVEWRFK